jgi:hypothetical protein
MYEDTRRGDDRETDVAAQIRAIPLWLMLAAAALIAFILVNFVLLP